MKIYIRWTMEGMAGITAPYQKGGDRLIPPGPSQSDPLDHRRDHQSPRNGEVEEIHYIRFPRKRHKPFV